MSYPGSKGQAGTWQRIIGQMPPHRIYVEAFAGSAEIYRRKRPAKINVLIEKNPAVSASLGARIRGAIVIAGDALEILAPELALLDGVSVKLGADALVYCDPPYVLQTRQHRRYYAHELEDHHHASLLALVDALPCMVMISGYPSSLYAAALKSPKWRCVTYQARHHRKTATECLWMNFPEPERLHDYRFTGRTYRERQSLTKQRRRWLARLERMKPLHRNFLLDAVQSRQF